MKRIIFLTILFLMVFCSSAFADGSVTVTVSHESQNLKKTVIEWIADASDATVPDAEIDDTLLIGSYLVLCITDPGSTAPTDDYDITIIDEYSVDVAGGQMIDRDEATSEQVVPKIDTVYASRLYGGVWTFNLDNNSVNSATGTCVLYFEVQ